MNQANNVVYLDDRVLKRFVEDVTFSVADAMLEPQYDDYSIRLALQNAIDCRMSYWRDALLRTRWTKDSATPIAREFWSDIILTHYPYPLFSSNDCAGVFLYFCKAIDAVFESPVN